MGADLGYVPVTGADDLDMTVDSDFRMLLKKATKKDTATKLKVRFVLVFISRYPVSGDI